MRLRTQERAYKESQEKNTNGDEQSLNENVKAIKLENESMTKHNKELKENIKQLTEQIQMLKRDHESTERQNRLYYLKEKADAVKSLQLQNDSLKKIIDNLEQRERDNNMIFTKRIQKLEKEKATDAESLTSQRDKLEQKAKDDIRKLNDLIGTLQQEIKEHKIRLDASVSNMKHQLDKHEKRGKKLSAELKDKEKALADLRTEKNGLINRHDAYIKKIQQKAENDRHVLLSTIQERDDVLTALRKEKDDLQNRLSSIAGEKLTKGNPAITDLGDPNRPMKIGEKYGELYDNEWTDAIECTGYLQQLHTELTAPEVEEIVIHHLYRIVTQCYQECLKLANDQLVSIAQMLQLDTSKITTDIESLPGCKEIAVIRRQNAEKVATVLYQTKVLVDKIVNSDWQYNWKSEELTRRIMETPFYEKCVHICWSMAIQNPAMVLSDAILPGTVYDKNLYKEFVQSGDKVKYVVWPALFLHKDGPLLFKGVVQAYK